MRSKSATLAVVAIVAVVTGCAGNDDQPSTAPAGESPSAHRSSGTPETPASSDPVSAGPSPADLPLVDRLIPTGDVPGLNARWRWQDGKTGPAGTELFGLCAKVDLASIGAVSAVERSYFPPDDSDDNAAEQIAEFPDAATAARAWSVLQSWHDQCKQKVHEHPGLRVRKLVDIAGAGAARWYLLSWTPDGDETGRFEAFGMVLHGTRLALLRMDSSGQDYDYPVGKEPIAAMLRAAAGWLD